MIRLALTILFVSLILIPAEGYCQKEKNENVENSEKKPLPIKIKIKYAEALFQAGNYYDAIIEYSEILNIKPDNSDAAYQMGECYFMARDYVNAEKWYAKLIETGTDGSFPLVYYRLATVQKMNGKYEEAKYSFAKFALRAEGDFIVRAKREIEACDFAMKAVDNPVPFDVSHLGSSINSPYSEYAPFVEEGKLYYSSLNRDTAMNPESRFLSHIYVSKKDSGAWKKETMMAPPFNSPDFHTGNISFSPDGNRAYFTKCFDNGEADIQCVIMRSKKEGSTWLQPVPIEMPVKEKDAKIKDTHPTIASENDLDIVYFSSNRPGGNGGLDLWYAEVTSDGLTSEPVNLGPAVNTIDDEVTPFFYKNKLYFSSNGHIGLGGYDVLVSSGLKNGWTKPVNLGYPLNSSADDIYFTKGESAKIYYLVSNRVGIIGLKSATCCDDIFTAYDNGIAKYAMKTRVFEKGDTSLDQLTGAKVEIFEVTSRNRIPVTEKLLAGDYEFSVEMVEGKDYEVKVQKKGYFTQTLQVLAKENPEAESILKDITLVKIEKNKAYTLEKIYYEFNKSSLTEDSKEALNKLYEMLVENPKLVVEIGAHTDDVGKEQYNQKLSQERAESCVDFLIYLGIESKRLIPKGYGETRPVAPNRNKDGSDNEEGRQENRRTEFKVIGELSRVGDKIIYD